MAVQENELDKEPWDMLPGEPNLWYDRFTLYRLLGAKRSLSAAHRVEITKSRKKSKYLPGSWREAAKLWNWDIRAQAWDEEQRTILECEAHQVISDGLALMHERVKSLKKRADKIDKYLDKEKKPSSYLIEQWRGLLSDIADEMGERVKTTKQEVSGSLDINGTKDALLAKLAELPQVDNIENTST